MTEEQVVSSDPEEPVTDVTQDDELPEDEDGLGEGSPQDEPEGGEGMIRAFVLSLALVLAGGASALACDNTPPPPKPPPPTVYLPKAYISPPCGDPMFRVTFDNRRSTAPVTFRLRFHSFTGGWVTRARTLAAGALVRSGYKHVTGGSLIMVRARGHLLAFHMAEAPGSYGKCPT